MCVEDLQGANCAVLEFEQLLILAVELVGQLSALDLQLLKVHLMLYLTSFLLLGRERARREGGNGESL